MSDHQPRREPPGEGPGLSGGLVGLLALALATMPAAAPLAPLRGGADDSLDVRVIDEVGRPRVGVRVLVGGIEARTDVDGRTRWSSGGELVIDGLGFARLEMRLERDVEVVLPLARDLVGTVESTAGEPLASARVELVILDAEGMPDERFAPRVVEADANGRFELGDLMPAPLRLRASAPGHAPTVVDVDEELAEVALALEPSEALAGVVYATDGSLAAGATVRLVGSGVWPAREVVTDRDGAFGFEDVPPGIYELSARRGADVASAASEGGASVGVELHLLPGRSLRGRVVDEVGAPVARATLSVTEEVVGLAPRELDVGSDGTFVLDGLAAEVVWVTARAPGHVGATLRATTGSGAVELVLTRGATLRGTVVDARGRPLPNVTVRFLGTAAAGAAPSGEQRAGGGLGVTAGPVPPIPLDAVLAPGEPSAVLVAGAVVVTDAAGTFVLDGVPAGLGELQADSAEHASARSGVLRLMAGEEREGLDLVLPDGGRIEGRVVDARRFPLGGVPVELSTDREPWARHARAGNDGRFSFAGVLGVAVLTARPFGLPAARARVEVGEGRVLEVELVVPTSLASVSLRVFDGRGAPVSGATLSLRSEDPSRPLERLGVSAEDGTFVFSDVPPDVRLRLEAQGTAGRFARTIEAADRELRVVLAPGGSVEARVVDVRGQRVSDVAARLEGASDRVGVSDAEGVVRFDELAPGDYELVAERADHWPARATLSVDEGRVSEVTLVTRPAGFLRGEVVDVLGDPVPDAEVRVEGGRVPDAEARALGEPFEVPSTRTDARGAFRLRVPTGIVRAVVVHTRAGGARSARVRVEQGEERELRLVTDGRLGPSSASSAAEARFVTAVAVAVGFVDGHVRVVELLDASARALRVGDVLVRVDDEPVFSVAQADALLRGPADVAALVVVRRGARERSVRVPRTRHLRE